MHQLLNGNNILEEKRFLELISDPAEIKENEIHDLKKIIDEFPFFQSGRALYLKGLNIHENYRFNNELGKSSIFITDRKRLFKIINSKTEQKKKVENNVDIKVDKPQSIETNKKYSFSEWVKLGNLKPKKKNIEDNIIDNFIALNPKISRLDKTSSVKNIAIDYSTKENHLMTETLAMVYLNQKKYDSAIKAYNILILNYPEKSSFFADQIKKIQTLQKNK